MSEPDQHAGKPSKPAAKAATPQRGSRASKPAARPAAKKTSKQAGKPATTRTAGRPASAQQDAGSAEPTVRPAELAPSAQVPSKRPARQQVRAAATRQAGGSRPASRHGTAGLRAVPDLPGEAIDEAGRDAVRAGGAGQDSSAILTPPYAGGPAVPGIASIEKGVSALIGVLRAAGSAAGLEGDQLEQRVARTLTFLHRRLTADYEIDDFGFDAEFTDEIWLPLLRPLYKRWFRVEVRGIENIPAEGGALVVANHSGTVPIDGLMLQVALHDQHPAHRHVKMLGADLVFQSPLVGELARKAGTTLAANADAERLLTTGELTAVFPEGFKGVGKPFSDRYRLQRFGRGGFVSAALRTGAPIIPCSIVGAEEIYPMIGNAKGLARLIGFPYFPITATFPWLGPLGAIPLPSKWIIEFGAPIETASLGAEGAEDPMLVFDLTDRVRETIQQTLYSLLLQRRSVFFS